MVVVEVPLGRFDDEPSQVVDLVVEWLLVGRRKVVDIGVGEGERGKEGKGKPLVLRILALSYPVTSRRGDGWVWVFGAAAVQDLGVAHRALARYVARAIIRSESWMRAW